MSIRSGDLYIQRRIISALLAIKNESESPESIAEKYILECLQRDHPGIMDVIDECEAEFETAKKRNQTRLILWRKTKTNFPNAKLDPGTIEAA